MRRLILALPLAVACLGCNSGEPLPDADAGPASDAGCPAGTTALKTACVPRLDSCKAGRVPVAGGGCQAVGVAACSGGLKALPDGACTRVGSKATCPTGWTRVTGGWCEPTLPAAACAGGTMEVIGQTSCQPVDDCGTGTWGAIKSTSQTIFVDGAYAGGGSDGTQAKPYTTIGAALAAAGTGAQIAVAAGTYQEELIVSKQVTLVGRCAAKVTLKGHSAAGLTDAALKLFADGAVARGLTVTGPSIGVYVRSASATLQQVVVADCGLYGLFAGDGATLTVKGSLISGNRGAGFSLQESGGTVAGTVIRGTRADTSGADGFGVDATYLDGHKLVVQDSVIAGNKRGGIRAHGGATTITGSVVRDTEPEPKSSLYGMGVQVLRQTQPTPTLAMTDCLLADNTTVGLSVQGVDATVAGVVVRGTQPRKLDGALGPGILVTRQGSSPARLTLRASALVENHRIGLAVEGSTAAVETTEIRETRASAVKQDGGFGVQLTAAGGAAASLKLTDCLLDQNRSVGLVAVDSSATLKRVMIRDTATRASDGQLGVGIQAWRDKAATTLDLRDATLTGNHSAAISVWGVAANLEGVALLDTRPALGKAKDLYGFGLEAKLVDKQPTVLTMKRCSVAGNRSAGILLLGSRATLEGCSVRETLPRASDDTLGVGVVARWDTLPARLTVTDSVVEGSRSGGVAISESRAVVRRSVVSNTRAAQDDGTSYGDGLGIEGTAKHPAELQVVGSLIQNSYRAGLLFVGRVSGSVTGSGITGSKIAVALTGGAAPTIGEDNVYQDNTEQLSTSADMTLAPLPSSLPDP